MMIMKNKDNTQETSLYETQEHLMEEVFDKEENPTKQFAVFIKETGKVFYVPEYELEDGKKLLPIQTPNLIDNRVVLLPTHTGVYFSERDLIKEIKEFLHKYLDIHPFHENVVAHYILMTWVFDRLSVVPYLRALGEFGTGKTRFIQAVGSLCYKPMFLAGATSDAYLFRVIELFNGTLVINEFERVNSDLQSQITIILNNGYEKGMPVGRVEGDKTREPRTFNVFCPKIFSTRKRFSDQALESRIISVPMRCTTRQDIPSFLDEIFWKEAERIRNKLLFYRFKNLNGLFLQEKENERKRNLLSQLEPRLKQTLLPLMYVITDIALEKQFVDFALEYQGQIVDARGNEIPGLIFQKLYDFYKTSDDGKITVKNITDAVNVDIEKEKYKLTSQRVGKIIREDLGFKTHKGAGGLYFIDISQKQLEYLIGRYGVESPLAPSSPLTDSDSKEDSVDLVDLNIEKEAELKTEPKPCYVCGSTEVWKTKDGSINCAICHPPVSEEKGT